MKTAAVERWLVKQTLTEAFLNLPVGLICLAAGLGVLALMTAMAYVAGFMIFQLIAALAKSIFDYNLRNFTPFCAIFCAAFLVWLFISHYKRNADYLRYSKYRTAKVHVSNAGFATALNVLLSGPGSDDELSTRLLYTGPQWFVSAISMFYKSITLLRMDIENCAKILIILLEKGSRVSFTQLAQLMPEINSVKVFPQLRDIAGVIFLQSEPSGISLTSDLRAELGRVLGIRVKIQPDPIFRARPKSPPPKPPPPPRVEEEQPGPHKILGVPRSATLAQIKAAYRRQIKQCHPDKFATLNSDWQKMAEHRAKIVNEAYAILTAQNGSR